MNDGQTNLVAGLALKGSEPTTVSLGDIHGWVVWQFPRRKAQMRYAAVKPSIAGHGWFPATIDAARKQITIYAHLEPVFDTPEAASRQLDNLLA